MAGVHPNVALSKRLGLRNSKGLIAADVVRHYFDPNLPDLRGDHVGLAGVRSFFEAIAQASSEAGRLLWAPWSSGAS